MSLGPLAHESLCLFRQIAHVDCPTCGMTRAFGALARGDVSRSFALHPWALPLAGQLAAGSAAWAKMAIARLPVRAAWLPRVVAWNAAIIAAIWLARMATGTLPD
jgi:hypothetical protein